MKCRVTESEVLLCFALFMAKKGWWITAFGRKEMKTTGYTTKNTRRATHTYGILKDASAHGCADTRLRFCFYSVKIPVNFPTLALHSLDTVCIFNSNLIKASVLGCQLRAKCKRIANFVLLIGINGSLLAVSKCEFYPAVLQNAVFTIFP